MLCVLEALNEKYATGVNMGDNFRDNFLNGIISDEKFDEFASELLQVEPPPSLVDAILTSISQIQLPAVQPGDVVKDVAPSM